MAQEAAGQDHSTQDAGKWGGDPARQMGGGACGGGGVRCNMLPQGRTVGICETAYSALSLCPFTLH